MPNVPNAIASEPARSEAGVVVVAHWKVAAEDQQRLADAIVSAWNRTTWPEGLVSVTTLVSTDGELVLRYVQWTSEAAHGDFERRHGLAWAPRLDETSLRATPQGPVTYRLQRSGVRDNPAVPGCIVVVTVLPVHRLA